MRRSTNPLFNDNKLKLGSFATNLNTNGHIVAPDSFEATWPRTVKCAQMVDEAGFEAIVPVARWKGPIPNEASHRAHRSLDPMIWAAGLAQATSYASIFATYHVYTIHPLVAAKQCATIDRISGGRFALNVVAGWSEEEFGMFGLSLPDHEDHYQRTEEWVHLLKRLWTEENEFTFEGKFYQLRQALSRPQPIQRPHIPLMNAGTSERGRRFAAEQVDIAFIALDPSDPEACRKPIEAYRGLARELGREIQVWGYSFTIQRDTRQEAREYEDYLVAHCDERGLRRLMERRLGRGSPMTPAELDVMKRRMSVGMGGFPLIGTPDDIAQRLIGVANAGLDGMLLTWPNAEDGIPRFLKDVLPRLEAAGVRKPHRR
jgi:alkanesulfonate monooxygenase SsuD/methylene tetrahydromethanopterin reductase-like flavin-dependent oxidoreductase (luciferase family)